MSGRRGSRRAEGRAAWRGPSALSLLGVVFLLVAAGLVLIAPDRPAGAPRPAASRGEPVTRTALVCPRVPPAPAGVRTSYGAGLAPGEEWGTAGSTEPSTALARGRTVELDPTDPAAGPTGVTGLDGFAPGLFAWRADTGSTTAVAECQTPRGNWWFSGAGAALDHASVLVLTNADRGPAVADVRAFTEDGEVDLSSTGGTGITVDPGETVTFPLVELAPQYDELALWVSTSRGRLVAAVRDRFAATPGADPGFEWLPAQAAPARRLRLGGMPARADTRTLIVANPTGSEAVVAVELAGPGGRFVPTELEELSVDPGTVVQVDLGGVLRGQPYAVRLRAGSPVLATVRSVVRGGDVAYAGSTPRLLDPAAAPVVGASTLQVSSGGETTRAEVTAYAASGDVVATAQLSLAAHSSTAWNVPRRAAYVVVVPRQGRGYAAIVYAGVSAVPLRPLPTDVLVPAVRPAA